LLAGEYSNFAGGTIFSRYLLTKIFFWQHPLMVFYFRPPPVRVILKRWLAALWLLALAFVTAFHPSARSEASIPFKSPSAVYATEDPAPPSADRPVVERCHVCIAIVVPADQALFEVRAHVLPLLAVRLTSFKPKIAGPPPKA